MITIASRLLRESRGREKPTVLMLVDRTELESQLFKVFGIDDPQGYLDKYSIAESIEDGTTVGLNYALAPSDLLVDRETLEREFLDLAAAQGVSDIDELNAILDRAVELKEMLKSPDRVSKVARYVAKHFLDNVEPMGFKERLTELADDLLRLRRE